MGQVNHGEKRGVFLTLGITFLSLVILALATLILRNAESSDDRLRELAAFDRVYNLDRALGDSFRKYDIDVGKFSIIANATNIILRKSTDRQIDPDFFSMVTLKGFFSIYVNTLYQNSIWNMLPFLGVDFSYFGLTFERQKSGQDIWYRYLFFGNETNLTSGVINSSYLHIFSFNASTPNDAGSVGSLELVIKADVRRPLNISIYRHQTTCNQQPCGTVRFRLKLLNFSNDPLCVPPFPETGAPSPACNTWQDVILSDSAPNVPYLKEIYYLDNLFAGSQEALRPAVLLGYFLYPVYSLGAFVAFGVGNGTVTATYNFNLTNQERIRVFDSAVALVNISGQQIGSFGPIRIL